MSEQMADSQMADSQMLNHLNDEQFSALLAGEALAGATQAHLDACAECRLEMERVAESMESFSALSLDWAERRSATMAPVRVPARAAWMRPLAWASATAVMALGVMVGVQHNQRSAVGNVAQVAAPQIGVLQTNGVESTPAVAPAQPVRHLTREQQIAEDNRMLLAIREELTRPDTMRTRRARAAHTMNDAVNN